MGARGKRQAAMGQVARAAPGLLLALPSLACAASRLRVAEVVGCADAGLLLALPSLAAKLGHEFLVLVRESARLRVLCVEVVAALAEALHVEAEASGKRREGVREDRVDALGVVCVVAIGLCVADALEVVAANARGVRLEHVDLEALEIGLHL